ncbi:MAG: hypothetical protein ABL977_12065 [Candidatus Eisenbacteria bacterium]
MDATQRKTIALAAYAIAVVLFVFFFGRQFWAWASWKESQGTIDFGFLKISSRPEFPNDVKSVTLGLIAPIVLAATGRVLGSGGGSPRT